MLNTKILMLATAIYLNVLGLCLVFLPQEIASFFEVETNQTLILVLQLLGSLYLGFGMMNWIAKNSLIGGIYNHPLVLGNLLHFLVSTFAIFKIVKHYSGTQFIVIISIAFLYVIFTLCFGYLLKSSPKI